MFSFFSKTNKDPAAALKEAIGDYELPSFPGAAMESMHRIRDPESAASDVAEVLEVDPGLSVKVLKMANSAVFSPRRPIENLTQAVALIGMSQLESLILGAAVGNCVPAEGSVDYDMHAFWRAAVRRGAVARSLAQVVCPAQQSECFTSGLLQDMAVPFLVRQRTDEYRPLLQQWRESGADLADLERSQFEWDHAEVATWMCANWHLPEAIASAIGGHHSDHDGLYQCPAPAALVALLPEGDSDAARKQLVDGAQARCGLPPDRAEEIIAESFEKAEDLLPLLV